MVKQADSGPWSLLAAIAAAITPMVVKTLIARRRRAPIQEREQTMCRNHSHMAGALLATAMEADATEYDILVEQPLTLELSTGVTLTLPPYCLCSVRVRHPGAFADLLHHLMAGPEGAELYRAATEPTSGHITPPK